MPERPPTHVVGSKAVRNFINALPDEWVAREPSEDYGIDVEVEVFRGGKATGLTFKVQSKGTNTPGSLTRQVKRKTINYWRRLDVPILVVLWDKSFGLRYLWAHTIGMDRPIDDGTKKISIRFDSSAVVDSAFVAGLPEFLGKYRSIKRGDIEPPLRVSLNVESDSGVDEGALRAEVQHLLSRTGDPAPFLLATTREGAAHLLIDKDRVVARAPLDLASASMSVGPTSSRTPEQLAMDLLVLMASAMTPINPEVAALLAHAGGPFSSLWASPETADRLAPVLAHPGGGHLLSWVLQLLHDDPAAHVAYDTYSLWAQASLEAMPDDDFERMTSSMREHLDAAAQDAEHLAEDERGLANADLGRRYFNLASVYRRHSEWHPSLTCLDIAKTLEPRYDDDPLFHEFVASCSWNSSDFKRCVIAYKRALALGSEDADRLTALLPDALFRAGRFREAHDALVNWTPVGAWFDRVPIVDRILLRSTLEYLSIEGQDTEPMTDDEWTKLTENDTRFLPEDEAREVLRTRSVFQPGLWSAVAAHRQLKDAFEPLLMAAVLRDSDEGLWVAAAIAGIVAGEDDEVVTAVVDAALFATKNRFYDFAQSWLATSDEGESSADTPTDAPTLIISPRNLKEQANALVALAGARMESVPSVGKEHQVRLVSSDDPSQSLVQRSL